MPSPGQIEEQLVYVIGIAGWGNMYAAKFGYVSDWLFAEKFQCRKDADEALENPALWHKPTKLEGCEVIKLVVSARRA